MRIDEINAQRLAEEFIADSQPPIVCGDFVSIDHRPIIILIAMFLLVSCGTTNNYDAHYARKAKKDRELILANAMRRRGLTGWEKELAHRMDERPLEKAPSVRIKARKGRQVWVEVKNDTGSDLFYTGHGRNEPRLFWNKKEDGSWVRDFHQWCGTDAYGYLLKDGMSLLLEFQAGGKSIQYFTRFYATDDKNVYNKKVYSVVKLFENDVANTKGDRGSP